LMGEKEGAIMSLVAGPEDAKKTSNVFGGGRGGRYKKKNGVPVNRTGNGKKKNVRLPFLGGEKAGMGLSKVKVPTRFAREKKTKMALIVLAINPKRGRPGLREICQGRGGFATKYGTDQRSVGDQLELRKRHSRLSRTERGAQIPLDETTICLEVFQGKKERKKEPRNSLLTPAEAFQKEGIRNLLEEGTARRKPLPAGKKGRE